MIFLTNLDITKILCSFRVILIRKVCKKIPQLPRLEFFEKFLESNFAMQKTTSVGP